MIGAVAVMALGASACGDDDTSAEDATTDEEYAALVGTLCEQHVDALEDAAEPQLNGSASDADIVAFWHADYIPRVRAFMRRLTDRGLPPDREQEILAAFAEVDTVLVRLDSDLYGLLDRSRNGDPGNDGTYDSVEADLDLLLESADIDCLTD